MLQTQIPVPVLLLPRMELVGGPIQSGREYCLIIQFHVLRFQESGSHPVVIQAVVEYSEKTKERGVLSLRTAQKARWQACFPSVPALLRTFLFPLFQSNCILTSTDPLLQT